MCTSQPAAGRVSSLDEPQAGGSARPAWTLAVWRPDLSRVLEESVEAVYGPWRESGQAGPPDPDEPHELDMTQIFRRALSGGLRVHGVRVSDRPFLDVGDPGRLAEALRRAELPRP